MRRALAALLLLTICARAGAHGKADAPWRFVLDDATARPLWSSTELAISPDSQTIAYDGKLFAAPFDPEGKRGEPVWVANPCSWPP